LNEPSQSPANAALKEILATARRYGLQAAAVRHKRWNDSRTKILISRYLLQEGKKLTVCAVTAAPGALLTRPWYTAWQSPTFANTKAPWQYSPEITHAPEI